MRTRTIYWGLLASVAAIAGCEGEPLFTKANPRFELKLPNGASVYTSRDDYVDIDELNITGSQGQGVSAKKVTINAQASPVRSVDVQQIQALVQQQLAFNQGLATVADAVTLGIGMLSQARVRSAAIRAAAKCPSCGQAIGMQDIYESTEWAMYEDLLRTRLQSLLSKIAQQAGAPTAAEANPQLPAAPSTQPSEAGGEQ